MRKLSAITFVSLDGVMQSPKLKNEDTSDGFVRGGWADPYWDDVMEQVEREAMSSPYDMLLGRKTYDLFAAHNANNSEPGFLDKLVKYVITNSRDELEWQNSIPLTGHIATEVKKLKSQDGPLIQIHGSSQLVNELILQDLLDELRLWIFPVLLGTGKRAFPKGIHTKSFRLLKSEPTGNGVVMTVYERIP